MITACKRIADDVVLFVGDGLFLDATGLTGPGWRAPQITNADHVLVAPVVLPADFRGGGYTLVGAVWTKLQWLIDAEATEAILKTQEEGKQELKTLLLDTAEWFIKFLQFYASREGLTDAQVPQGLRDYRDAVLDAIAKRDG